jgi:hypothetical protein
VLVAWPGALFLDLLHYGSSNPTAPRSPPTPPPPTHPHCHSCPPPNRQIADRALVVAAELADRYITSRFLPDKAIDLVDEACSNLQVRRMRHACSSACLEHEGAIENGGACCQNCLQLPSCMPAL